MPCFQLLRKNNLEAQRPTRAYCSGVSMERDQIMAQYSKTSKIANRMEGVMGIMDGKYGWDQRLPLLLLDQKEIIVYLLLNYGASFLNFILNQA